MNRFTDIESKPIQLPPVYGYLSHPLLPLEKALEPIASQINQLSRYKKIAINECHFPSEHGLTRDESAAVYLSCSTSLSIIKNFVGSNSTLFLIEAVNGKDISNYTNFPSESEVILCPGTRLRVVSDPLDQTPMCVVHL
ncbi:unnamed protein product [Rotaria socialis]|uniref:Uncharacterized protein n=1 Tax=Rotaria socialis TaxID=392032 RepID=A0A820YZ67_9BILA|nr:unnamed protein product [Rotaria socialis]